MKLAPSAQPMNLPTGCNALPGGILICIRSQFTCEALDDYGCGILASLRICAEQAAFEQQRDDGRLHDICATGCRMRMHIGSWNHGPARHQHTEARGLSGFQREVTILAHIEKDHVFALNTDEHVAR